jgi:hypothetical protein
MEPWSFLEWQCVSHGGFPNFELAFFHHETIGCPWKGAEINAASLDGFGARFAAFSPRKPKSGFLGAAAREPTA